MITNDAGVATANSPGVKNRQEAKLNKMEHKSKFYKIKQEVKVQDIVQDRDKKSKRNHK